MTRIAIVGPGAIGGTVAAWLAQVPGMEISLCVRTAFARLEVKTPAAGVLVAHPRIVTSPENAGAADWVLVATKAYDVAGAAAWLRHLVGPDTTVAILQNGVEHIERFEGIVPRHQLLPVMVDLPAERTAPGQIHQRGKGWMKVPDSESGKKFAQLFAATQIDVQTTPDFRSAVWTKLCINCAGAVSAVTLQPNRVTHLPEIAELMRGLVRECIAVGRAEGATLPEELVDSVVKGYQTAPADGVNSLLADRLAGRPLEADARNGVIVRRGAKHGIPTPLNQTMVALLAVPR